MAAPGEFFPQSFAMGILQLAAAQKQFGARLREQRSQAAARNFLEKQRIELAEAAQAQDRAHGDNRARSGLGTFTDPVSNFRKMSAESAMGVRDQLQLEAGTREIDRQARNREKADDALTPRALGDIEDKGFAFVADRDQDKIPAIRQAVRLKTGTGFDPNVTPETQTAANAQRGQAKLAREKAGLPTEEFDLAEVDVPGGTLIVRVGGATLKDKTQVAELRRAQEETRQTMADTALTKAQFANSQALAAQKLYDLRQKAKGMGADTSDLKRHQAGISLFVAGEKAKDLIVNRLTAEANSIIRQREGGLGTPEDASRLKEINIEIQQARQASPAELARKRYPEVADFLKTINDFHDASAIAAGETRMGKARPGGDPELAKLFDKQLKKVMAMEPIDFAQELTEITGKDGKPFITSEERHKVLPVNVRVPLRNSASGEREEAKFHAAREGLIPLNKSGVVLARMIDRATPQQTQAALRSAGITGPARINLHPRWREFSPAVGKPRPLKPEVNVEQPGTGEEPQESPGDRAAKESRARELLEALKRAQTPEEKKQIAAQIEAL